MNEQVFKQSIIGGIVISVAVVGVFIFLFFVQSVTNPFLFLILLFPVIFILGIQKTKLVIENDVLRYEKLFGGEEISLNTKNQNRSGISFGGNNQAVNQERSTEKVVYVIDDAGRTFFSFPAGLVTRKDRSRFEEAVTAINPNIQVF